MIQPPQPPPLPFPHSNPDPISPASIAPPAAGRPWTLSEIFSWAVILLLVALTVYVTTMSKLRADPNQDNPSLEAAARVAVAQHNSPLRQPAADTEALSALQKEAKSPDDQLRLAIVIGELEGRPGALDYTEKLSRSVPSLQPDIDVLRHLYVNDALPSPNQWTAFHDRYGWFADLAQSQGKHAGDPLRAQVLNTAYRALLGWLLALGTALVCALAGTALFITALVLWTKCRLRPAFSTNLVPGDPPADRRAYVQAFACYIAGMTLPALVLVAMLPRRPLWLEAIILPAAFAAGILWPILVGQSLREWRAAFGLHTGRGVVREIASGLIGYVAGVPLILLSTLLMFLIAKLVGMPSPHPVVQEISSGSWWLKAAIVALASIWAPVTEELMFRGALFSHLRERFGWWISAPIVALIFALIHPQGLATVPVLAAIALVLAAIREWRGTILASMAAHSLHNTLLMIFALLTMT